MTQFEEQDYELVVHQVEETKFLPGTAIEIIHDVELASPPEHVLFDFDGTLSLVREGWPKVMVPMMVEVLIDTNTDESTEILHGVVSDFVMKLNGKQTIYQMIRLAEEVEKRGSPPQEPEAYKQQYHDRLMDRIRDRREALRCGKVAPEEMLVPGSLDLLAALREKGTKLYLASGTDEEYVKQEADMLTLTRFFGDRIHGAVDNYKTFSKAHVIQRILEMNQVTGARLLGFGDGYVEIQNIKSIGGTAVAVASDEAARSGKPDAWKRDRLIGVGADIVVPDFQEYGEMLRYLWR